MKNNDKLKALSDREQAREKLPVFYGSRDNYLHGVREVIGNSIDEIINNFDSGTIEVDLIDNLRVRVFDTGRGLPIQKDGDEILLFEKMFAGTKYDETDDVSIGTNGLGNTVLNYTSRFFQAKVYSKKEIKTITYTNGGQNKKIEVEKNNTNIEHGTSIEFELDPNCYTNIIIDEYEIERIVRHFSATTNKITFIFNGKKYHYDSIKDYFEDNYCNPLIKLFSYCDEFDNDEEKNKYEIVFGASAKFPIQQTYLNNTYLEEKGSIYNGFIKEFTNSVNELSRKLHYKKAKDDDYTEKDIEKIISFVVTCDSNRVEFANQTKFSTNKRLYNTQIKQLTKSMVELYANTNKKEFKKLIEALNKVHEISTQAYKVQKKLANDLKKKVNIYNNIEGLVDCKEHKDSELYIVEGRSALSSVVLSRDPKTQAAFPLRGKILNTWNETTSKVLLNKELSNLTKAIGIGLKNTHKKEDNNLNVEDSRYKKIIIATDADEDGFQIASLLIAFFKKFMPEIIENNMLYVVNTPLYVIHTNSDKYYYAYSEREKDKVLGKVKEKYTISRLKGLGEVSPEDMALFGMNKETRKLKLITNDELSNISLENWFGKDTNVRKEMILS